MTEQGPTTGMLARLTARFPPTTLPGGIVPALLLVRFLGAYTWAWGVKSKLPWNDFGWFPGWIEKEIMYAEIPPYKWFLETIVQPNITLFGWAMFFVETTLAILLILGLFNGLAGLLATLWTANIVLGSYPIPGEWIPGILAFLLLGVLTWAGRPGRAFGLDAKLRPKMLEDGRAWVRWIATHGM